MNIKSTCPRLETYFIIFLVTMTPCLLHAQHINSFSPTLGRIGTSVTINGTGFDALTSKNIVFFGATRATVQSASPTQLVVSVPVGSTYQPISVTTGGLTTYSSLPFITIFGCASAFNASSVGNKISFSTGTFSSPISIAIADFDGDGKPDLAVTDQDNNTVSVFRNTSVSSTISNTSFAAAVNFLTEDGPAGIAIGDIDGDGKPDMAITNNLNSSISVYRNTSVVGVINVLSFAPEVILRTSTASTDNAGTANISIGDLDGDGKPDLAVTNSSKNTVSIFRNTATLGIINTGSFSSKIDLSTGDTPVGLVIADFDGDGKADIAVNNAYGFNFSVFRNTSSTGVINTSSFASRVNFNTEVGTSSLVSGDLNNDGKPELVVTNTLDNSISIFRNTATPGIINSSTFAGRVNFATPTNPVNAMITDINGDGKPDIAVSSWDFDTDNTSSNPLSLFANNTISLAITSSSFASRVDYIAGGSSGKIGVGDVDSDGKPDFVIPNYTTDNIFVLKNKASNFTSLPPVTLNGSNVFCDESVWKHFYDADDATRIICSIRDNGNNLGNTNASVFVDATPVNYNGTYLMARHYVIKPTTQPASGIQVRLYFTVAEFNALKALDNRIATPGDLNITKYQGPAEDGIFNPSDATSLQILPSSSINTGTAFNGYYADFTVNSLSEFWLNSGTVVLPVQLLYFNAEKLDNVVSLQWSTASEFNSDYFNVERSSDGIVFSTIGTVHAGSSSVQPLKYELKDLTPLNGPNYYRLKQVDKDGKISYSNIKIVLWTGQTVYKIKIAPQPMKDQATVSFRANAGNNIFMIYNAQGAAVQQYTLNTITNGNAQLNIKKDGLSPGIYFYKIVSNNQEVYHGKLIVE